MTDSLDVSISPIVAQGIEDIVATCIRHCAAIYGFDADDAIASIRFVLPPLRQNWDNVTIRDKKNKELAPDDDAWEEALEALDDLPPLHRDTPDDDVWEEALKALDDPATGIPPLRQNWDNVTIRDNRKKETTKAPTTTAPTVKTPTTTAPTTKAQKKSITPIRTRQTEPDSSDGSDSDDSVEFDDPPSDINWRRRSARLHPFIPPEPIIVRTKTKTKTK